MGLLRDGYIAEDSRYLVKTLGLGCLGELGIHLAPLVLLAGRGVFEVGDRVALGTCRERRGYLYVGRSLHEAVKSLSVLFFLLRRLGEYEFYLLEALFGRLGREKHVTIASLRFSGESLHEINLCLCSFYARHLVIPPKVRLKKIENRKPAKIFYKNLCNSLGYCIKSNKKGGNTKDAL